MAYVLKSSKESSAEENQAREGRSVNRELLLHVRENASEDHSFLVIHIRIRSRCKLAPQISGAEVDCTDSLDQDNPKAGFRPGSRIDHVVFNQNRAINLTRARLAPKKINFIRLFRASTSCPQHAQPYYLTSHQNLTVHST
jgi:hypothetical protein